MPFIRYMSEENTADGKKQEVHFINVDQISDATYDHQSRTFEAFIGDKPQGKGWGFKLKGQEATEALAIFQTLYRDVLVRAEK